VKKALVILAFMLTACSCQVPQSWQQWVMNHEKPVSHDNSQNVDQGSCGYYDWTTDTPHLDENCMKGYGDAKQQSFWRAHEYGHGVMLKLGIYFLDKGCNAWYCLGVGAERAANCFAKLVTGIVANLKYPEAGYWDCPLWAENHVEDRLIQEGITWDTHDLTLADPNYVKGTQ
jgi:hypothetical protein